MSVWIGVLSIAVGIPGLGLLAFRDRASKNSARSLDPAWQIVASSFGVILVGVENVWPQYQVSKAGVVPVAVAMVPRCIQLLREFFRDSIVGPGI